PAGESPVRSGLRPFTGKTACHSPGNVHCMQESLIDPATGKPRLLAEMCSTCVFRPGNLMRLRPGRLKDLIRQNTGPEAQGLHCHQTTYGQNPETGLA